MSVISFERRRELASHVLIGGYYADGERLYEVEAIGPATGCVVFRDVVSGWDRCLSIEDFRSRLWLVRGPAGMAA